MHFDIITIFPEIFSSYFDESIIKKGLEKNLFSIQSHDLRDWTEDKHKTVDDTPYGGGAGMVMKIEPLHKALQALGRGKQESVIRRAPIPNSRIPKFSSSRTVLLSAKGKRWTQAKAREYAQLDRVVFICGRYEGVDERIKNFIDDEISIGDYVMTGGELGAMVMIDSIARLLPGVLGNAESAVNESHTIKGVLEHPQYTKPEVYETGGKKYRVPKVLLSGNHAEIAEWRRKKSKKTR